MKFKKILIYFILFIFFSYPIVVLAQTYVPADCTDQKNYNTNEYQILQCITCESKTNWDAFFLSVSKNLPDIDEEYTEDKIRKENKIKGEYCDADQEVIIGKKILNQPEISTPTETDSTQNPVSPIDSFKELETDLFKIIEIIQSNERFLEFNTMFRTLASQSSAPTKNKVSVLENEINSINNVKNKLPNDKFIEVLNSTKDLYISFKLRKNEAQLIFNEKLKLLINSSEKEYQNTSYKMFITNQDVNNISYGEHIKYIQNFLKKHLGYVDEENDNVRIVDEFIKLYENEISQAKNIKIEEDDNNEEQERRIAEEEERKKKERIKFIKEIQSALKTLGYKVVVDGEFGPGTQDAINRWTKEKRNENNNNTGEIEKNSEEYETLILHKTKRIEKERIVEEKLPEIKNALRYLGYGKKITGKGINVEKGIKEFQASQGLQKTGSFFDINDNFNDVLYKKLLRIYENRKAEERRLNAGVPDIQKYLTILGFYTDKIDGELGNKTTIAINDWEEDNNITDSLITNYKINDKIFNKLKKQADETVENIKTTIEKIEASKLAYDNIITSIKKITGKIDSVYSASKELKNNINETIVEFDIEKIEKEDLENEKEKFDKLEKKVVNKIANIENLFKDLEGINYNEEIKNYNSLIENVNIKSNDYFKNEVLKKVNQQLDSSEIESKINQYKDNKDSQIDELNSLKSNITNQIEKINDKQKGNPYILVGSLFLILIIIVGGGTFIYLNNKKRIKKETEEAEKEIILARERLEKEKLERENLELKENLDKKVEDKIQEKIEKEIKEKQLTPEEQKFKLKQEKLNDYYNALKDISFVENFQNKWEAIGLKERQSDKDSQNRTLTIDPRTFSKSNFWAIPYKDGYSIYAGRVLRANIAALTANDNQWAKELFEGIFDISIESGEEFLTKNIAVASREGDTFTITKKGVVLIPSRNN